MVLEEAETTAPLRAMRRLGGVEVACAMGHLSLEGSFRWPGLGHRMIGMLDKQSSPGRQGGRGKTGLKFFIIFLLFFCCFSITCRLFFNYLPLPFFGSLC
jgi:hypothetical protein